jgi:uncharacterized membrane protein (DUF106 family)
MKPAMHITIPRLYVFVIVITVIFASVTAVALFIGRNIVTYLFNLWAWVGFFLIGLIGAILIGMYISYRFLSMRSFTPFEKEMMEMRVEVSDLKRTAEEIRAKLNAMPGCEPPATPAPRKGKDDEADTGAK